MAEAIADRLAEAIAEKLHEMVRKDLWGYAPDENFDNEDLIKVRSVWKSNHSSTNLLFM